VSAPAIVIRLELEASPRVIVDALHEGECERLHWWFEEHAEQLELIRRAYEIADEGQPA
jgi:hypothetical protein